jgi:hypothetical protein
MAWMYFLAVIVFLGAFIFIANKGAFYYDDEK